MKFPGVFDVQLESGRNRQRVVPVHQKDELEVAAVDQVCFRRCEVLPPVERFEYRVAAHFRFGEDGPEFGDGGGIGRIESMTGQV